MSEPIDSPARLAERLHTLLLEHPAGLGEYQLLQKLRGEGCALLGQAPLSEPLSLFRSHFLIFHALYRLRDQLWQQGAAHLSISPLLIQLLPYSAAEAALTADDPLRSYYLDLNQLADTDADEVQRLLRCFWQRLRGGEEREAALQLFGLSAAEATEPGALKCRFRQLASQHHPDRGGETARLQAINQAREILYRYYPQ
jgi:hypothetical protein